MARAGGAEVGALRGLVILVRIHPVEEAVRARPRQIEWVLIDSERRDRRVQELKRLCREQGVSVRYGDRRALDRAGGPGNQGVVARLAVRDYLPEEDALAGKPGGRFLFVLDEVQDPHNLGAVLRVAEAVGAGVVVPERGSAPLSDAVARSSAGAVERVPVVRVGNLRRFVDLLKEKGFRVIGLDPAGASVFETDLTGDLALVLGAEGKGMRRLVREGCDLLASLPMAGGVASLNVSTAAAAAGYEAVRQRGAPPGRPRRGGAEKSEKEY
jgi:23S rRNA (guanosine2251-2'-O)-methyltransferase